ncbi:hypothetical protein ACFFS2_06140 [Streptomyces aurantiacus]|uniref:DUF1877 family protein n=1 Tax=Streptomyces aurantiacus TaxID=47760 RepID=A0A7G1P1W1_9ACTN|nr:hypothetical protein [Streptomyces aurantiacus]BCL29002.1 hypothetical protein GCM10017557_38610 [Streptomyces aurantiacus]
MSLSVDVYVPLAEGGIEVLDVPPGSSDAAGRERWRTEVWGSEPVRSLGARFLPRLATEDLTVAPDEVADFIAECDLVRTHLARIAEHMRAEPETGPRQSPSQRADDVSRRLDNIVDAARRASDVGGGVIIW